MVMEFGEAYTMIHTLVNGVSLKLRGMVCTFGRMEIAMKENGSKC